MKKIVSLLIIFILSICCFSIVSNATEDEQEAQELVTFTFDNYYKYNEELHNQNQNVVRAVTYNSDSEDEEETLSLEEYIYQESRKCSEKIDVSSYKIAKSDAKTVLVPFLYYDEMFYINTISYMPDDDGYVSYITFNYTLTESEIASGWEEIDKQVRIYKAGIKSEWNNLETIIYTNNFICKLCEYEDLSQVVATTHTLYGALVAKKPVCDGYSHAFRYLLKQVGINADIATSTSMNHAWNLVEIDDEYYHVDVTWNDTYYNEVEGVGKTCYEFFLASDDSFQSDRASSHTSWVSDHTATSTKYDTGMPWSDAENYLIYKDDYWYMMGSTTNTYNANLYKVSLREKNSFIRTLVKTNNTSDYIFLAPGFTTDGTNLYYSTEFKIYQMDFEGENLTEYYCLSTTQKCIYSIEILNDVFYYDTLDLETSSSGTVTADIDTRVTNECTVYEPEEITVFTTLDTIDVESDDRDVIILERGTLISDVLIEENFPVMDKNYIVEIYSQTDLLKSSTENAGSKNIIRITNQTADTVLKEYIVVVRGDVSGDGILRMYDAFQILKDVILGTELTDVEKLIEDYNDDGNIRMYDAFQFLKIAIFSI